jgi:DNA-binding NtrC family response regulator
MKEEKNIIIVEDNLFYQEMIKSHFDDKNYNVTAFATAEDMLVHKEKAHLIILDYDLAGQMNGLELLHYLKINDYPAPVIFLSGQEDIEVAVNSLKSGAFDYVIKDENAFNQIDVAISRFLIFEERKNSKKGFLNGLFK